MTDLDFEELDRAVSGVVVRPGDAGYDEARSVWNARFDRRPEVAVGARVARDVVAAVDCAREQGLRLSVKGGGHAYAANTVAEGGLLIDLSPMKAIHVDPAARTARVEAGVTWGELDAATQAHGLATPGPTVSSVGVAGSLLGGGNGYLSRRHGMVIDNLIAADLVTADGRLIRASADEHPDLFWALRGGGGNFGVAVAFDLRLHPVGPTVLSGQIVHRLQHAPAVLRAVRGFMAEAGEDIQCYPFVLRVPPIPEFPTELHGEIVLDLVTFHADPDGEEALRPLLDHGDPVLAFVGPQPYAEVQRSFDAGLPPGQRYESKSHDLESLSDAAIATFVDRAARLPGAFTMAYLAPGGGAIARVEPTATAFPHRLAPYSLHVLAGWTDPGEDDEITAWAQDFHDAMAPFSTGGVYVNLLATDEPDRVPAAYGVNHDRLVELKGRWDPENLFRSNHNIEPPLRG